MGSAQSSEGSASEELEKSSRLFSSAEKQQISQLFEKIKPFTKENFCQFVGGRMPVDLAQNLYDYIVYIQESHVKQGVVEKGAFLITLGHMMKGITEDHAAIVFFLSGGKDGVQVTKEDLKNCVNGMIKSYCQCLKSTEEYKYWQGSEDSVERLVDYIVGSCDHEGPIDRDVVRKWLPNTSFLLRMMNFVACTVFPVSIIDKESLVSGSSTRCLLPINTTEKGPSQSSLLDLPSLLYINHHLPGECHSPWRLLFSSTHHGQSFATMIRAIADKGPTLIVIKDTGGHIFGGFASQSWKPNPQFVGSSSCLLFNCYPNIAIYHTSGHNENYMYFNHGQDTMPNGIGMGGQLDHFGLWLDYDFGSGHSRAKPQCSTYGSPQLSSETNFSIHTIEVWGVGLPPKKPTADDDDEAKRSILDKDPAAKAMLTLIGKGPVSEGLREADATRDIPEEHSLPPM